MNRSHKEIAVVGSGMSGLACAAALTAVGHRVDVFEKSRGPAGRMSTRRGEDDPCAERAAGQSTWQCDHGAQYFTASDPRFRAEVERWTQAGAAALWLGRIASVDAAGGWATSSRATERFVGTPRMTSPATWALQELGDRAGFRPQHTVQKVERVAEGWAVSSAEHGCIDARYDALMVALPAPQAHALLASVAPAAAVVAASVPMRGSWALMLRFDAPVDLPCDGAFINTGPLRWIARDSSKPGRRGPETWLLHASAEWSEAHIEDDAATVTRTLLAAFATLGDHPVPRAASAHRWRYADTAPASPTPEAGHWWDAEQQLGLCGDWLNGGKVEGAWLSGHLLAHRLSAPSLPT